MAAALPKPTVSYLLNSDWIYGHIDELAEQYHSQWVAAFENRVIAAGPGLARVTEEAKRQAPAADIAYHFVDDGTLIY